MPSFRNLTRAEAIVVQAAARLRWRRILLRLRSRWSRPAENDVIFKAAVISLGILSSLTAAIAVFSL
jgi:hypothetical protein